ncbi:MAG: hypothetical protein HN846_03655 [Candidatus Pacebacteria bacterium]|nr:hypothetical protein [Candidatus Paceibacterota bacterium]MBT3511785.1 hypothetical protein [Candidatus Paceibacterota bacterium]MBT4005109.1 hypothetical protein [Candidatus Paceibacterota bacterium]MBT4358889.1 hypothetical protein [Candidatus Paceibacterota bacterium]MBT4681217.1 hypothetical protein [Candidatus Paceibacterota bacterium]
MSLKLNFRFKKKPSLKQKSRFVDKLMDWGNLVFVGSFLFQLISQKSLNYLGATGFVIWMFTMAIGFFLL